MTLLCDISSTGCLVEYSRSTMGVQRSACISYHNCSSSDRQMRPNPSARTSVALRRRRHHDANDHVMFLSRSLEVVAASCSGWSSSPSPSLPPQTGTHDRRCHTPFMSTLQHSTVQHKHRSAALQSAHDRRASSLVACAGLRWRGVGRAPSTPARRRHQRRLDLTMLERHCCCNTAFKHHDGPGSRAAAEGSCGAHSGLSSCDVQFVYHARCQLRPTCI